MATSGTVLSKSKSVRRLILNHRLIHIKVLHFVMVSDQTLVCNQCINTVCGNALRLISPGAEFVLCRSHACVGLALLCSCSTCHSLLHATCTIA